MKGSDAQGERGSGPTSASRGAMRVTRDPSLPFGPSFFPGNPAWRLPRRGPHRWVRPSRARGMVWAPRGSNQDLDQTGPADPDPARDE